MKKQPKPTAPTAIELEDAAACFERWAGAIRKFGGSALGNVTLKWDQEKPHIVKVSVNGALDAEGFRKDLRPMAEFMMRDRDGEG